MKQKYASLVLALIFCFFALLTLSSEIASSSAATALDMCLNSVVPSLFPFMVASSLLVSMGGANKLAEILPVARIFSLPRRSSGAVILGALCGFPLGAATAVELYKRGAVSKKQAEALISVSNNTGPSFVVSVIGASFFKNAAFGWWLYFLQLAGALIAGIAVNRIILPIKNIADKSENIGQKYDGFASSFTDAVKNSVSSVINVCGFIMFFSVLGAYIKVFFDTFSPIGGCAVLSFLELTAASKSAAGFGKAGVFFAGFSLGFSGLSVFCQAASFTFPEKLSLCRTFAVKLIQGLFCGAVAYLSANRFTLCPAEPVMGGVSSPLGVPCALIFAFLALKNLINTYNVKKHLIYRRKFNIIDWNE